MSKKTRTIFCLVGALIGIIINIYFNKTPQAFDFALAALIGAGVTSWIISMSDNE